MWELVSEENVGPRGTQKSDRMKVPGGWILRTVVDAGSFNGGVSVDHIFINDRDYEWKLEE